MEQAKTSKYFHIVRQFFRYIITGGIAFVVDFSLFALFLYVFKFHYLIANLIGLIGGLILNYLISITWVFAGCKRTLRQKRGIEFFVFALIGGFGVGLNQALMLLSVEFLEINEMLAKIIAAGIVLLWNFLARKLLLFKSVIQR